MRQIWNCQNSVIEECHLEKKAILNGIKVIILDLEASNDDDDDKGGL